MVTISSPSSTRCPSRPSRARSTLSSRSAGPASAAPTCTSSRGSGMRRCTPRCPTRSATGTPAVVIGAGGLGHIGVQCLAALTATTIIVVDRNPDALKLAAQIGADHTVVADGTQAGAVRELTGGRGAHVVLDFVAEQGAEADGWAMTGGGGSYFVIGYGGTVQVPTLDIISTERNIIGNIVGTYNDLAELMALAEGGRVT